MTRQTGNTRQGQRGAIAIIVGLSLFVLIGIIGLVLDLGHMFVAKTELQNAADGCALAAARELDGQPDALTRAVAAGIATGTRNSVDFQSKAVTILSDDVKFSPNLSPNLAYVSVSGGASPATAKYAMCTATQTGIAPYVMQVLGFGPQTVSATAVASLRPAQTACAIPLGMCVPTTAPTTCTTPGSTPDSMGFCVGDWYDGRFSSGGGQVTMSGNFDWIDFTPPSGGASELSALLEGKGQCDLSVSNNVGETGAISSLSTAWNSRFGLYKNGNGNPQATDAPPDFTGYAYTPTSWPAQSDAYSDYVGNSPGPAFNFKNNRTQHRPYQGDVATGLATGGSFTSLTSQQLTSSGQDRRLVTVPVVNCSGYASANTVPILQWACVMMLAPMNPNPSGQTIYMEYRGLANMPGSPCATSGLAGGTAGPKIPTLVQ